MWGVRNVYLIHIVDHFLHEIYVVHTDYTTNPIPWYGLCLSNHPGSNILHMVDSLPTLVESPIGRVEPVGGISTDNAMVQTEENKDEGPTWELNAKTFLCHVYPMKDGNMLAIV